MIIQDEQGFLELYKAISTPNGTYELVSNAASAEFGMPDQFVCGFALISGAHKAFLMAGMLQNFSEAIDNASARGTVVTLPEDLGYAIVIGGDAEDSGTVIHRNNNNYDALAVQKPALSDGSFQIHTDLIPQGTRYSAEFSGTLGLGASSSDGLRLGENNGESVDESPAVETYCYMTLIPRWVYGLNLRRAVLLNGDALGTVDDSRKVLVPSADATYLLNGRTTVINPGYMNDDSATPVRVSLECLFVVQSRNHLGGLGYPNHHKLAILPATESYTSDDTEVVVVPPAGEDDSDVLYQIKSPLTHSSGIGHKTELLDVVWRP